MSGQTKLRMDVRTTSSIWRVYCSQNSIGTANAIAVITAALRAVIWYFGIFKVLMYIAVQVVQVDQCIEQDSEGREV